MRTHRLPYIYDFLFASNFDAEAYSMQHRIQNQDKSDNEVRKELPIRDRLFSKDSLRSANI